MDSAELLRDLELIPETLPLALNATNIAAIAPAPHVGRWVFVGMGSSRFAAGAIAAQLRAIGVDASAEYASADLLPATGAGTALVAISAGGTSLETLDSFARAAPGTYRIAVTNRAGSPITAHADAVVDMLAGEERSGVACRSYVQTLAVLLGLAAPLGLDIDPARTIDHAVAATRELLATRAHWLPPVLDALAGGDGTWLLAPSERLASAEQGALMIRECPRRMADACETGDWSHVDVYLTKTLAYRAIVFAGSRYESEAVRWMVERGSRFVAVGAAVEHATAAVRFPNDDDPFVRLLVETLVPSLVANEWWSARPA